MIQHHICQKVSNFSDLKLTTYMIVVIIPMFSDVEQHQCGEKLNNHISTAHRPCQECCGVNNFIENNIKIIIRKYHNLFPIFSLSYVFILKPPLWLLCKNMYISHCRSQLTIISYSIFKKESWKWIRNIWNTLNVQQKVINHDMS